MIITEQNTTIINNRKILNLKVNNFKANSQYLKEIIESNDIIYLNELWLHQSEEKVIKDILPINKLLYFKSSMDDSYKRGRPFGGQAWIVNSNLYKQSINFISDNISELTFHCTSNYKLKIIGVYLPQVNGDVVRLTEYSSLLKIISTLISVDYFNREAMLCIGDFNADPNRLTANKNDFEFRNFLTKTSATLISQLFTQRAGYTYNNGNHFAHLDHVICNGSANQTE